MAQTPSFDSGDEMDGDAHHANEAGDGCKRQGFAGDTDHVDELRLRRGCRFVLVHGLFWCQAHWTYVGLKWNVREQT